MTTKFQIQTRYFGSGKDVVYDCPNCGHNLISPLDEAGITDFCPACNGTFVVPGNEIRKREIEIERRKAEKAARDEEKKAAERLRKQSEFEESERRAREQERIRLQTQNASAPVVINNTTTQTESTLVWALLWFFLGLPTATFLCLTIIGIPFGLAMFIWFIIGLMKRLE